VIDVKIGKRIISGVGALFLVTGLLASVIPTPRAYAAADRYGYDGKRTPTTTYSVVNTTDPTDRVGTFCVAVNVPSLSPGS